MSRPTRGPPGDLPVRGCHPLWPDVPVRSGFRHAATGLVRVRSPLLTESRLMSFPPANEMFQFAGFASPSYVFRRRYRRSGGFPHSEIRGSTIARISPRLIAACYVLHRLSVPRHPPDALRRLFFEAATRRVKPRARELAKTQHTQPQTSLSAGRSCRLGQNFFTMSKSVKLSTISYQLSTDNPGHQPGQTLLPFPSAPASPRLSTLRLQPFAPG